MLASQGYATVSVRVNGINAQDYRLDDGGADARAEIVERHLDHWAGLAAEHQLDLDQVVLVGHSRGGEGVDRASIQIPLSAPYRIAGQVLVAPTNFGVQTAAYVPTVTLLPYCDGDVSDLQGQKFTDVARDLAAGDTSLKSSVLVMGANHNFFNTEWTPGIAAGAVLGRLGRRPGQRLRPGQRRPADRRRSSRRSVRRTSPAPCTCSPTTSRTCCRCSTAPARGSPSTGDAQVLSHAIGGGRDVRAPERRRDPLAARRRDHPVLPQRPSTRTGSRPAARGVDFGWVWPHWTEAWENAPTRTFFEMRWTAAGQTGGLLLDDPLDLSDDRLELRTIVDPAGGPVDLQVRITDADGGSALLDSVGGALPAIAGGSDTAKYWAQALVADPSGATGVDLTRIVRVDLVAGTDAGPAVGRRPRGRAGRAGPGPRPAAGHRRPPRRAGRRG